MVKVRAVSALAALVVFPLAILLLLAGAVAVLVRLASDGHSGLPVIKLLILPLVIAVYVGVKQIRADRPQAPGGPELTRSEHPLLWAEVERLAAVAQTEPPHRITLVPDVNAAVVEVGGRREMIVGLPLLATMSVGELRSVLAHELGHFAGGDTALSARTARAQLFLVAVADRSSGVVRPLLRGYAHLYARVSAASSRDMESAADGFSLRVAGSRTAADAMRQLVATSLAWSTLARDYVPLFDDARLRASLTEGLRQLVAANREGLAAATDEVLAHERPSWSDTHPPTSERIAAFLAAGVAAPATAQGAPDAGRPAADLVAEGWLDRAESRLLVQPRPLASWREVVAAGLARQGRENAQEVMKALRSSGHPADSYADVIELVTADPSVGRSFTESQDPAAIRGAAESVLAGAVVAALVEGGRVSAVESWDGPWLLVDTTTGEDVMISDRVADALDSPEGSASLREWLVLHGADLDARPQEARR